MLVYINVILKIGGNVRKENGEMELKSLRMVCNS